MSRSAPIRKQAGLYYKCPPTARGAIGSTCRSLVESLDQVHVFVPRPTFQGLACLNGIPIPIEGIIDGILLFLLELVDAGQRALSRPFKLSQRDCRPPCRRPTPVVHSG